MIYLVEDDAGIRELVLYALNGSGQQAQGFGTPSAFWQAMRRETPALILLDIMLPEEDGLQILKKLRADPRTVRTPVIMLTARGSEPDKVLGLEAGADDYLPKPFGMMELLARVRALLRRAAEPAATEQYQAACLTVWPRRHQVEVSGRAVALTPKEFELLTVLMQNRGLVLSRDQLLNRIWGYDFDGENRTVDVHIRTLRQKLGPAGELIETVRGVGYRIGGDGQ